MSLESKVFDYIEDTRQPHPKVIKVVTLEEAQKLEEEVKRLRKLLDEAVETGNRMGKGW